MSVLSFPRLNFFGQVGWNPATNNNSPGFGYDKNPVTVLLQDGQSFETFDDWLIELNQNGTTNGDWNVYGQMQANMDAKVVSALTKPNAPDASDPALGAEIQFSNGTPKLVDINPYSPFTSQVFLQDVGVATASNVGFYGAASSRMTSRRPMPSTRNIQANNVQIAGRMSVIWQTTIATDDLHWLSQNDKSPAMAALQAAMDDAGTLGVMIRYATYTTLYFTHQKNTPQGWRSQPVIEMYKPLAELYAASLPITPDNISTVFNPAVSTVTGSIGLWQNHDMKTVSNKRIMASATPTGSQIHLGPANAQVNQDQGVVSLDLQTTIPETDQDNTKADVGTLTLQCVGSSGTTTVGTLTSDQYAKDAYEQAGGIVDFPFSGDWPTLQSGQMQLVADPSKATSLAELPLYADTDERGVYLDQGESKSFTVQVFAGDAPATSPTKLRAVTNDPSVSLTGGTGSTSDMTFDVGSDGTAEIGVLSAAEGTAMVLFLPYPADQQAPDVPTSPDPTTGYSAVRALSYNDDLDSIPQADITWDVVYEKCLRPFDLVYRGMSCGIFDLGDQTTIRQNATRIRYATSPNLIDSPGFMPVTRDMSRGRRNLLMRYLFPQDTPTS